MNEIQKIARLLIEKLDPIEIRELVDFLDEASERAIDKLRDTIIEGVKINA